MAARSRGVKRTAADIPIECDYDTTVDEHGDIEVDELVAEQPADGQHGAGTSSSHSSLSRKAARRPAGSWRPHGAKAATHYGKLDTEGVLQMAALWPADRPLRHNRANASDEMLEYEEEARELAWPAGIVPYSRRVLDGVKTAVMAMSCSPSTADRVCTAKPVCLPDELLTCSFLVDLAVFKEDADTLLHDGYGVWGTGVVMPPYYLYVDTDEMTVATVAVRKDAKGEHVAVDPFNWQVKCVWHTHPRSMGLFKRRAYYGKPATATKWRWAVLCYEWLGAGHPNDMPPIDTSGPTRRPKESRRLLAKDWRSMLAHAASGVDGTDVQYATDETVHNETGETDLKECTAGTGKRMNDPTQHEELLFALSVASSLEGMRPANREYAKLQIQRLVSEVQLAERGIDAGAINRPHAPHVVKAAAEADGDTGGKALDHGV